MRRQLRPLLVAVALLSCVLACSGVARAASSGGASLGPSSNSPTGGASTVRGATNHKRKAASKKSTSKKKASTKKPSTHKSTTTATSAPKTITPVSSTPGSGTGAQILTYAKRFTGVPYLNGGNGPHSFDCSGFTSYVFAHFGYHLDRSSYDQMKEGRAVHGALEVGDLVFWDDGGHVGIYAGNNTFISATVHKGIWIYSFAVWRQTQTWTTARRILGGTALTHATAFMVHAARGMPRNGGPADATP